MSAMGTTTPAMTFEEFERLPDEPGKLELLEGELVHLPPAKIRHQRIALRLYEILWGTVQSLRQSGSALELGDVYHETGYRLGDSWVQPDVSIAHVRQTEGDYLEGAPALAAEVISPANTAEQMDRKVKQYLSNGGWEVWLVYPETGRVWLYRQGLPVARLCEGVLSSDLLPGAEIDLKALLTG
jgi:Uma2 family endonuclease